MKTLRQCAQATARVAPPAETGGRGWFCPALTGEGMYDPVTVRRMRAVPIGLPGATSPLAAGGLLCRNSPDGRRTWLVLGSGFWLRGLTPRRTKEVVCPPVLGCGGASFSSLPGWIGRSVLGEL